MGLYTDMLNETVGELNLREAITVPPSISVREVVALLRNRNLGCVIVTDSQQRPLGLFTEAILRRLMAENLPALDDSVERHMARELPLAKTTDPVVVVLEAMQQRKQRFVCVVDEEGHVTALTGQKGLMEYVAEHFPDKLYNQPISTHLPHAQREGA